jgi:hypothetical protein
VPVTGTIGVAASAGSTLNVPPVHAAPLIESKNAHAAW